MMSEKIYPIAVIGGGAAGTMAALRAILNNDEVIVFPGSSRDRRRSRAFWVAKVENIPAHFKYRKGIVEPGKETFSWIAESDFKDNFHLIKNTGIEEIRKIDDFFQLMTHKGETYRAKHIILCTGVMDVQPMIDGSIDPILPYANVQLADYCLRCDGHHVFGKKTSVIGHGNGAAWVSIMLYERYKTPSMAVLTNGEEPEFTEETQALLDRYGIEVRKERITKVLGKAKDLILEGFELEGKTRFETEICFISLGMICYNELAVQLGAEVDDRGFVITDAKGLSSVEGLYVAGDLRAGIKKQIYTAWDSAVDSADAINGLIRQNKRNS